MLKEKLNNIILILKRKEIHIKDIFLLFLIVISLSFWVIYTSFAIFTDTITKSNIASLILEVPTYTITSSSELFNSETKQITVPANETLRFDLTISSTSSGNTKYKVYYEMISPASLPDTLTVGVNSFSDNPKTDLIALNNTESKNIDIEILNSGNDSATLKFDVLGGYPNNEVVLPENKFELIEFSPTTEITKTSNTNEISLKDSTAGNLTDYKIYGDSFQSNLPDGYQEVEYIESTGTQYIDIGFVPNNNTITKIKFSQSIDEGNGAIFGARITNNNEYRVQVSMSSDKTEKTIQRVFGNQINGFTSDYYNWSKDTVYEMEFGKSVYINDILIDTFTDASFTANKNLYLFGFNGNGVLTTPTSSKVYYFKIYDNGILIRNMIPCYKKSDNTIGMYDTVNDVFYTNSGTGTFLKGDDSVPTPDNPIDVVSLGENSKNLFGGTFNSKFVFDNPIPVGTVITATGDNTSSQCYVRYFDINDNEIYNGRLSSIRSDRRFVSWTATGDVYSCMFTTANIPNLSITIGDDVNYRPYRYVDVENKGKNLFDISQYSHLTDFDDLSFSNVVYPAGTYTINFNFNNINNRLAFLRIYNEDKDTVIATSSSLETSGIINSTFTSPTKWCIRVYYNGWANHEQAVSLFNNSTNIQIEEGSTATSYEPYVAPSTTTIDLSKSKNLFDPKTENISKKSISQLVDGYMSNVALYGGIWTPNALIPFAGKENTQYTISAKLKCETTDMLGVGFYYSDGTISPGNRQNDTDWFSATAISTPNKTVTHIGFFYGSNGSAWIKEMMIEEGSQATEYVPYFSGEPLRKIGDVADYIDYKNGKIVRNVGKYQFTGDEEFSQSDSMSTDTSVAYYTSSVVPAPKINGTLGYMNIGHTIGMSKQKSYSNCFIYNSNSYHFLRITKNNIPNWSDDLTSVEKLNLFKAYLAQQYANGTPVTIYYQLDTPDDTETINLPQISTFEGTNIFRILNGSLSLTYNKKT